MYNGYLKNGIFPERWKKAKIIPIMKPGTQTCEEVTKYRPISLLNVGGKILERALINRLNHYKYSMEFLNKNQYGFIPQTSSTDAIMALKDFVQKGFSKGEITAIVSLDVEGAFNSAWAPSVLKKFTRKRMPTKLIQSHKKLLQQKKSKHGNKQHQTGKSSE